MASAGKIDAGKGSEIARVMAEVVADNIGEMRTREEIKPSRENQNVADVWSTEGTPTNLSK